MEFLNKKVLVFGAGKSGVSATRLLQEQEAFVILYDGNKNLNKDGFKDKFNIEKKFELVLGEFPEEMIGELDLAIISPGIAIDNPYVKKLMTANIPVWGEVELAYQLSKGKLIGITGTNGKTTTTFLAGEILKTYFNEVFVVGNIGNPYTDIASLTTDSSFTVAELSSFQLETIHKFKPDVSVILNISQDHLNRHHNMETYIKVKERITENQDKSQLCILNYEEPVLRDMASRLDVKTVFFSSMRPLDNGLFLDKDCIMLSKDGKRQVICNLNELELIGRHNYENVMAAVAITVYLGVPIKHIREAITSFHAVEHRIEDVDTINGVTYYNDSKGTNPEASIKAIEAMQGPTILIAGGFDKGAKFEHWIKAFDNKVKYLVLIGQTSQKIEKAAKKQGFNNIFIADNLEEAVKVSAREAVTGDNVLLSPACASWGMFTSYEERGNLFKKYVHDLNKAGV